MNDTDIDLELEREDIDAPEWKEQRPFRHWKRGGKYLDGTGVPREAQKLPKLPYEYWMKPNGNVVRVAMMTTSSITNDEVEDPDRYKLFNRRRLLRAGWMPWKWRLVKMYESESRQYSADGMGYSRAIAGVETERDWIVRRKEIQAARRKIHEEKAAAFEETFQAQEQRIARATGAAVSGAMSEAMNQLTDALRNIQQGGRAKKSDG